MQGFFTLLVLQFSAPLLSIASLDQSGMLRRETHTVLTHKGEIIKLQEGSDVELVLAKRHAQGPAPAAETTEATEEVSTVIGPDGEKRAVPHVDDCAKAFHIGFKVTAECGEGFFDSNDQIFLTTENHALEIQILGPKYEEHSHKISAWFKTESGKGAHHKGIKSGQSFKQNPTGELMVGPITCGQEYLCTFEKTKRNLTLDCGGDFHDFDTPDPNVVFNDATERKFDMVENTTELLLGILAGSGDHALHGRLSDVTMSCPSFDVNTTAANATASQGKNKGKGKGKGK